MFTGPTLRFIDQVCSKSVFDTWSFHIECSFQTEALAAACRFTRTARLVLYFLVFVVFFVVLVFFFLVFVFAILVPPHNYVQDLDRQSQSRPIQLRSISSRP